jgi:signal transduction histidine kinase
MLLGFSFGAFGGKLSLADQELRDPKQSYYATRVFCSWDDERVSICRRTHTSVSRNTIASI